MIPFLLQAYHNLLQVLGTVINISTVHVIIIIFAVYL